MESTTDKQDEKASQAAFSEEQKDILTRIGLALILIQTTEHMIQFCMTYALPKGGIVTLAMLESQQNGARKKTLGQFLGELRKRVDLDDGFDTMLEEFLEKRNTLIHRIGDIPDWSLNHEAGLQAARRFTDRLIQLNDVVLRVFFGLARAWQTQTQITTPADSLFRPTGFFGEIDQVYSALAASIFFEKPT
jgi:hypothetical protein